MTGSTLCLVLGRTYQRGHNGGGIDQIVSGFLLNTQRRVDVITFCCTMGLLFFVFVFCQNLFSTGMLPRQDLPFDATVVDTQIVPDEPQQIQVRKYTAIVVVILVVRWRRSPERVVVMVTAARRLCCCFVGDRSTVVLRRCGLLV